jgi:hypothetical protein
MTYLLWCDLTKNDTKWATMLRINNIFIMGQIYIPKKRYDMVDLA